MYGWWIFFRCALLTTFDTIDRKRLDLNEKKKTARVPYKRLETNLRRQTDFVGINVYSGGKVVLPPHEQSWHFYEIKLFSRERHQVWIYGKAILKICRRTLEDFFVLFERWRVFRELDFKGVFKDTIVNDLQRSIDAWYLLSCLGKEIHEDRVYGTFEVLESSGRWKTTTKNLV